MYSPSALRKLFLFGCVTARLMIGSVVLILLEYENTREVRAVVGISLITMATALLISAIATWLGYKTKGGFGGKQWWVALRYFHIGLYATAGQFALMDVRFVPGIILFFDVLLGFTASFWLQGK